MLRGAERVMLRGRREVDDKRGVEREMIRWAERV